MTSSGNSPSSPPPARGQPKIDLVRVLQRRLDAKVEDRVLWPLEGESGATGYVLGWQDCVAQLERLLEPVDGVALVEARVETNADDHTD